MTDKEKRAAEERLASNKKRISEGLAKGKTFYFRGGKKLRGERQEEKVTTPPAAPSQPAKAKEESKDK